MFLLKRHVKFFLAVGVISLALFSCSKKADAALSPDDKIAGNVTEEFKIIDWKDKAKNEKPMPQWLNEFFRGNKSLFYNNFSLPENLVVFDVVYTGQESDDIIAAAEKTNNDFALLLAEQLNAMLESVLDEKILDVEQNIDNAGINPIVRENPLLWKDKVVINSDNFFEQMPMPADFVAAMAAKFKRYDFWQRVEYPDDKTKNYIFYGFYTITPEDYYALKANFVNEFILSLSDPEMKNAVAKEFTATLPKQAQ